MDNQEWLDEALSRGIITNDQRQKMAGISGEQKGDSQERLKPIGTMNEIFVTAGVMVLFAGIGGLLAQLLHSALFAGVIDAAIAWAVALKFHQAKRFRLPIIYCCLHAAMVLAMACKWQLMGVGAPAVTPPGWYHPYGHGYIPHTTSLAESLVPLVVGGAVLAASAWRFRIPFMMLPIGVLFAVAVTIAARSADGTASLRVLLGGCGLAVLAVAVYFDLKDPQRVTRWSDFAFWSYVIGSPLFVHSLFLSLILNTGARFQLMLGGALSIALLAAAVSFAGLLLNRRALILSTLFYVGYVIFRLLAGVIALGGPATMLLLTLVIIGLYVTLLGSRWAQVRRGVMRRLPAGWAWLSKLPPYADR